MDIKDKQTTLISLNVRYRYRLIKIKETLFKMQGVGKYLVTQWYDHTMMIENACYNSMYVLPFFVRLSHFAANVCFCF